MEEIKKAIEMVRSMTSDDPDLVKQLAQLDLTLQGADKRDAELVAKHTKLINDYRELAMSNPAPTPARFTPNEGGDNPPPTPEKQISFDEALNSILAKRTKGK